jgi:hypothetical protein
MSARADLHDIMDVWDILDIAPPSGPRPIGRVEHLRDGDLEQGRIGCCGDDVARSLAVP